MVLHPVAAAERIRRAPTWVASAATLVIAAMGASLLLRSQIVAVTLHHLPPTATPTDKETLSSFFRMRLGADIAFLPARLLAGWACTALLLYFLNKIWSPNAPVRIAQVFSLEVHAEAALVLARVVTAISGLWATGPGSAVRVPFGLDALFPTGGTPLLAAALNSVNPFSLWYVALIAVGLARIGGLRPATGWVTSLAAWLLTTGLNITVLELIGQRLHLLL